MGTLFYVIVRLSGYVDEAADLVHISFLISTDTIAVLLAAHLCMNRKKK